MDLIQGKNLQRGADLRPVTANEALAGKDIICFYFSGHWCPPCRQFTPILKDFYEEVSDKGVEIIFVSSDRSPADMKSYMEESHGAWLSVEHESELAKALEKLFDISGIPALVICKADGTVVSKNGRADVQKKGPKALQAWK